MSYFDDASLVMIPSGYKDQKVYSVKPLDGSGDLTFSRASSATRVASNGLIEKVRTNVMTYSQDFSNANWVPFDASRTGSQTDPNGGTTASLYTSQTNSANLSANFATASSSPYTFSIYIKGTSSGSVSLRVDSGSTAAQNNISYTTSWQRFTYTFTAGASTSTVVLGGYATFTTGEGIYVAFAQAELGDIATDYIATTSAAVSVGPVSGLPRLDYLNSTCPRLLLEPQRTNLLTYSEQLNNAAWNNTLYPVTITANQTASPSGYLDADLITPTAALSRHAVGESASGTAGSVYTASAFFKKGGSRYVVLTDGGDAVWHIVTADLDTATITNQTNATGTITNYGNGWYRVTCTFTRTNTSTIDIWVGASNTASAVALPSFNDVTLTTYAWGIQLEAGAYATSYIPTLGTSVTRVADAASKTGISSLIGSTAGTLFFEGTVNTNGEAADVFLLYNSSNISLGAYLVGFNTSGNITLYALPSASLSILKSGDNRNTRVKIALAYQSGDLVAYVNGVQTFSSAGISLAAGLSALFLNSNNTPANYGIGTYNQALLFKTRLTNAQLAELTTL